MVYKPVFIFLIDFTLQNYETVQPYGPTFSYYLSRSFPGGRENEGYAHHDFADDELHPLMEFSCLPHIILLIHSFIVIVNSTKTGWTISLIFNMDASNCSTIQKGAMTGGVKLSIDNKWGAVPNITAAGLCPEYIESLGIDPGT